MRRRAEMGDVTLAVISERLDGCQEREQDERNRVNSRLRSLEEGQDAIRADLTFLRGRLSGFLPILIALGSIGGVASAVIAALK